MFFKVFFNEKDGFFSRASGFREDPKSLKLLEGIEAETATEAMEVFWSRCPQGVFKVNLIFLSEGWNYGQEIRVLPETFPSFGQAWIAGQKEASQLRDTNGANPFVQVVPVY